MLCIPTYTLFPDYFGKISFLQSFELIENFQVILEFYRNNVLQQQLWQIEELVILISLVCSVVDIPWKRGWQPTSVFLPAESHGQRRLAGYSPQGHKESDIAEATQHTCVQIYYGLWSQPKLSQLLHFLAVSSCESLQTSLSVKGFFK